jgi:hypothetical protein
MKLKHCDLKDLNQKMNNCLEYHSNITKELLKEMLNLTRKSVKHSYEFSSLCSDCIADIREDIEIPFSDKDKESYKSFTQSSNDDGLKSGIKFLQELEKRSKKVISQTCN